MTPDFPRDRLDPARLPRRTPEKAEKIKFHLAFGDVETILPLRLIIDGIKTTMGLNDPVLPQIPECGLYMQSGIDQVAVFWGRNSQVVQVVDFENDLLDIKQFDGFTSVLSSGQPLLTFLSLTKHKIVDWFLIDNKTNSSVHFSLEAKDGILEPELGFVGQFKLREFCKVPEISDAKFMWMPEGFGLTEYLEFLRLNYGNLPRS